MSPTIPKSLFKFSCSPIQKVHLLHMETKPKSLFKFSWLSDPENSLATYGTQPKSLCKFSCSSTLRLLHMARHPYARSATSSCAQAVLWFTFPIPLPDPVQASVAAMSLLLCARDVALAQGLYCGVLHCCAGSAHLLQ
jgi:hypothetical protein